MCFIGRIVHYYFKSKVNLGASIATAIHLLLVVICKSDLFLTLIKRLQFESHNEWSSSVFFETCGLVDNML